MTVRGDVSEYFSVYEYGKTTPKKVYLFGAWKSLPAFFKPLVNDLVRNGFAVVLFMPKKKLIAVGTPYAEIVKAGRLVAEEVAHRVKIDKVIGVRGFASFGVSFGTLFATETAKRIPEITRLVLLSPFGDFSRHVELWPTHRYFSKVLASQPTKRAESGHVLNKIGIAGNIELLKDKKVLIGYSRNDRVIHSEVTEELVRRLNHNGIDAESVIVRGGHVRGILTHLALKKSYKKFLGLSARSRPQLLIAKLAAKR